MILLCFIDSLGSGGAQRQLLAVAKHMKQRRHEVYIAWYANDDFYRSSFEKIGVGCIHRIANSLHDRIRVFSEAVNEVKPDTVLAFLSGPSFYSCFWKGISFSKWNLVMSIRGNNLQRFLSLKKKIVRPVYFKARRIVCNSYAEAEVWNKHCSYLKKKVIVIPNYVVVPNSYRNMVQKDKDVIRIIVPANLCSDIKNPMNVAKALTLLADKDRRRVLIDWYGRRYNGDILSPVCEQLEKYVKEHDLDSCFVTHDETREIYSKMATSDWVCLFSTEEGLPNVICEGMMMGKPVMMTKVSDWKQLIDGNGIVCEGTDARSISVALGKMITYSKEDMMTMGNRSLELASMLFDENVITKKWESVLFN